MDVKLFFGPGASLLSLALPYLFPAIPRQFAAMGVIAGLSFMIVSYFPSISIGPAILGVVGITLLGGAVSWHLALKDGILSPTAHPAARDVAGVALPQKPVTPIEKQPSVQRSVSQVEVPKPDSRSQMGDNNTIVGKVDLPRRMGSGNTMVGPTDANGNAILTEGMSIGAGAGHDPTSVIIGAGAGANIRSNPQAD